MATVRRSTATRRRYGSARTGPSWPREGVTPAARSCPRGRSTPRPIDPARRAGGAVDRCPSRAGPPVQPRRAAGCVRSHRPASDAPGPQPSPAHPRPHPRHLPDGLAPPRRSGRGRHRCRGHDPVGWPARPDQPRCPDLRPADGRLRPDRQDRAGPVPARAAAGRGLRGGAAPGPRRHDDGRGPDVLAEQRASIPLRSSAAAADNAAGTSERGASTITQQLVRARLLPEDVVAPGADRYLRKAKELIQSSRLTAAYPGEEGKETVITAYLNEIFYGHDAYGIAAAARIYFGVTDLAKLTPAQAALLAGLPKSPSNFDPYRFARKSKDGKLVVPPTAPPVARRDYILQNLSSSRWTRLTPEELEEALAEPVVLARRHPALLPGAPLHVAGPSPAPADPRPRRADRDRRLHGDHDPRLAGPAARREVAGRRGDRART